VRFLFYFPKIKKGFPFYSHQFYTLPYKTGYDKEE